MTQSFVETPEQVQSALMHGTRQFRRQRPRVDTAALSVNSIAIA
jgi:hypothetical protein